MKKHRHSINLLFLVIFVIITVYIISTNPIEKYNQLITLTTAVFGIILIMYQLGKDHKIKKAEFIYSLNTGFTSNEEIRYIYLKLKRNRDNNVILTPDDGLRMAEYIMFFDIMGYLIEEKMISISMVDRLFDSMFFIFVNNEYVQKYQFQYPGLNRPIIELYVKWYNYRITNKTTELYCTNSFKTYGQLFIEKKNGHIVINETQMITQ